MKSVIISNHIYSLNLHINNFLIELLLAKLMLGGIMVEYLSNVVVPRKRGNVSLVLN